MLTSAFFVSVLSIFTLQYSAFLVCNKHPGCGVNLPDQNLDPSDRYNASGECRSLYNELSAYFMMNPDITFKAQHAVDAYGAQHSGGITKNITNAFSLIGLYLTIEHGYTGRQVQLAHMELAKKTIQWPTLDLPTKHYSLTVADVLKAEKESNRKEMLMKWAKHVWDTWERHHEWTRNIYASYLKHY
ncbi:DUF5946 family protein [Brevibacillus borstelensis]|nr:DUF5946 family protein [Brevibacillus borstelensis]